MSRITDERIHRWPKVRQAKGAVSLAARVLTPARLYTMRECLFKPLYLLWKIAVLAAVSDIVIDLWLEPGHSWILDAGWSRAHVWWAIAGAVVVWHMEQFFKFPLCRLLFGRSIRIEVHDDKVRIGGRLIRKRFARDQHLTFAMEPIHDAVDRFYRKSMFLFLIIGDSARYQCAEIFNTGKEPRIVSNANMLLEVGEESTSHDTDVDPTRQQTA